MEDKPSTSFNLFKKTIFVVPLRAIAGAVGCFSLIGAVWVAILAYCYPIFYRVDVHSEGDVTIYAELDYGGKEKQRRAFYSFDSDADGQAHCFWLPRAFDSAEMGLIFRSADVKGVDIQMLGVEVAGLTFRVLTPAKFLEAFELDGNGRVTACDDKCVHVEFDKDGVCRFTPRDGARYAWSNWELEIDSADVLKLILDLVIAFNILLLISFVSSWKTRNVRMFRPFDSACSAFMLSFFVFIVLPMQYFLSASGDYPFSVWRLLSDLAPVFVASFVISFISLAMSSCAFGRIPMFAVFAVLVYEYIQTGILSANAPPCRGELSYYQQHSLLVRDFLVMGASVAVAVCGFVWLRKKLLIMWLVFFALIVASLFDVKRDSGSVLVEGDMPKAVDNNEVLQDLTFSSNRNVIVLVIDSVTTEVCCDVLSNDSELASSLEGFTCFQNNLGMMQETDVATVGIFTGNYFSQKTNRRAVADFARTVFSPGSAFMDYWSGCDGFWGRMGTKILGGGFVRRGRLSLDEPCATGRGVGIEIKNSFRWRSPEAFATSVSDMTMFRLTPYCWKVRVSGFTGMLQGVCDEEFEYPQIEKAKISSDMDTSFVFCHTFGAHVPHDVKRNGKRIYSSIETSEYGDYCEHVQYVFTQVVELLLKLKQKGVYDNSLIALIADHGSHLYQDTKRELTSYADLPPRAFPMLMVKPIEARWPLVIDETTPTTHANFYKLLKEVRTKDLSIDEIRNVLRAERRKVVISSRRDWREWVVDEGGKVENFRCVED